MFRASSESVKMSKRLRLKQCFLWWLSRDQPSAVLSKWSQEACEKLSVFDSRVVSNATSSNNETISVVSGLTLGGSQKFSVVDSRIGSMSISSTPKNYLESSRPLKSVISIGSLNTQANYCPSLSLSKLCVCLQDVCVCSPLRVLLQKLLIKLARAGVCHDHTCVCFLSPCSCLTPLCICWSTGETGFPRVEASHSELTINSNPEATTVPATPAKKVDAHSSRRFVEQLEPLSSSESSIFDLNSLKTSEDEEHSPTMIASNSPSKLERLKNSFLKGREKTCKLKVQMKFKLRDIHEANLSLWRELTKPHYKIDSHKPGDSMPLCCRPFDIEPAPFYWSKSEKSRYYYEQYLKHDTSMPPDRVPLTAIREMVLRLKAEILKNEMRTEQLLKMKGKSDNFNKFHTRTLLSYGNSDIYKRQKVPQVEFLSVSPLSLNRKSSDEKFGRSLETIAKNLRANAAIEAANAAMLSSLRFDRSHCAAYGAKGNGGLQIPKHRRRVQPAVPPIRSYQDAIDAIDICAMEMGLHLPSGLLHKKVTQKHKCAFHSSMVPIHGNNLICPVHPEESAHFQNRRSKRALASVLASPLRMTSGYKTPSESDGRIPVADISFLNGGGKFRLNDHNDCPATVENKLHCSTTEMAVPKVNAAEVCVDTHRRAPYPILAEGEPYFTPPVLVGRSGVCKSSESKDTQNHPPYPISNDVVEDAVAGLCVATIGKSEETGYCSIKKTIRGSLLDAVSHLDKQILLPNSPTGVDVVEELRVDDVVNVKESDEVEDVKNTAGTVEIEKDQEVMQVDVVDVVDVVEGCHVEDTLRTENTENDQITSVVVQETVQADVVEEARQTEVCEETLQAGVVDVDDGAQDPKLKVKVVPHGTERQDWKKDLKKVDAPKRSSRSHKQTNNKFEGSVPHLASCFERIIGASRNEQE